jgi:hypothetical protein
MGMMGSWPSPNCVCNDFWQQTYQRTGVLEFSRDRCRQLLLLLVLLLAPNSAALHCFHTVSGCSVACQVYVLRRLLWS